MKTIFLVACFLLAVPLGCAKTKTDEQLFLDLRESLRHAMSADDATSDFEEIEAILKELKERELVTVARKKGLSDVEYNEILNALRQEPDVVFCTGNPVTNEITVYRRR